MDLGDKKSLTEVTPMMNEEDIKKYCSDCKTSRTPLWRGGPAGPKSLCNACGIKYRKKRRAILGLNNGSENKKVKWHSSASSSSSSLSPTSTITTNSNGFDEGDMKPGGRFSGLNETVKIRLFALGSEVLLQKSSSSSSSSSTWVVKKQRCQRKRKLRPEEVAAFSLMALSYGLVFA